MIPDVIAVYSIVRMPYVVLIMVITISLWYGRIIGVDPSLRADD
jgi:hypothetical protein